MKMLRKTISALEITWLTLAYRRNDPVHRLAVLEQDKLLVCFDNAIRSVKGEDGLISQKGSQQLHSISTPDPSHPQGLKRETQIFPPAPLRNAE